MINYNNLNDNKKTEFEIKDFGKKDVADYCIVKSELNSQANNRDINIINLYKIKNQFGSIESFNIEFSDTVLYDADFSLDMKLHKNSQLSTEVALKKLIGDDNFKRLVKDSISKQAYNALNKAIKEVVYSTDEDINDIADLSVSLVLYRDDEMFIDVDFHSSDDDYLWLAQDDIQAAQDYIIKKEKIGISVIEQYNILEDYNFEKEISDDLFDHYKNMEKKMSVIK